MRKLTFKKTPMTTTQVYIYRYEDSISNDDKEFTEKFDFLPEKDVDQTVLNQKKYLNRRFNLVPRDSEDFEDKIMIVRKTITGKILSDRSGKHRSIKLVTRKGTILVNYYARVVQP